MSVNRDAMYATFEEQPGDFTGYRAMSDELADLGYADLAHAFAWMAERGKFPHKRERYCDTRGNAARRVPVTSRWAWYRDSYWRERIDFVLPHSKTESHTLPGLVLPGWQKTFRSHQQAVMYLAQQLAILRNTYSAEPPKVVGLPLAMSLIDDAADAIREAPAFTDEGDGTEE